MPLKPSMSRPNNAGDVNLDPFQLESLRPLLQEHEVQLKEYMDRKFRELREIIEKCPPPSEAEVVKSSQNIMGSIGSQIVGLKAAASSHLVKTIERVKANDAMLKSASRLKSLGSIKVYASEWFKLGSPARFLHVYDYLVDFVVLSYAICLGVEIHWASQNRSEPDWAWSMEVVFCAIFSVDLCVRLVLLERRRFFTGSHRWWNLCDTMSLATMIGALLYGGRFVGNVASFVRLARVLRMVRCLWTFRHQLTKWAHLRHLQVLVLSMAESTKVMAWLGLLVLVINYGSGMVLTEAVWSHCPSADTPLFCDSFQDLLRTMMTLYQIQYHGLLWGELWREAADHLPWYVQASFLGFVCFALMILVNTVTSFICSLQSTVSKRERELLIDNTIESNEQLIKQLYTIFRDFDQNGNGSVSWAEFQLALEDERMNAFLGSLELDMSDAVKVFQILASEQTGAIEEHDFLLGCLRLRGGATAVDMVRMQMEQEWQHNALLQMKVMLQKQQEWQQNAFPQMRAMLRNSVMDSSVAISDEYQRGASSNKDADTEVHADAPQVLHHFQRTNLKAVERSITVQELDIIRRELLLFCEGWEDSMTGEAIPLSKLNLYHFSYHYILPKTAPQAGVLLQWTSSKEIKVGEEIYQTSEDMKLPRAKGVIASVERENSELHIWVRLSQGQFQREGGPVFAGGQELPGDEMTVTARDSISYKELLSTEACLPIWYCSHWWGEPIVSFVACCEQHAKLRRLGPQGTYWVCGYANRQHELDVEITESVLETSFFSALSKSRGLLLLLDESAMPFRRIWCDFELYSAVTRPGMELDIVTIGTSGTSDTSRLEAKFLTKNVIPGESVVAKSRREKDFPLFLLENGLQVALERGQATREVDRTHILQAIAQNSNILSGVGKYQLQMNLARANQTLHSTMAILAWPQAVHKNLVPKKDAEDVLNICEPLRSDGFRQSLDLSLAHFESLTDYVLDTLCGSLPSNLVNLKLSFEGCEQLTDVALQSTAAGILQLSHLRRLHLDFVGCHKLTDAGLRLLSKSLATSHLSELELHFAGCRAIHEPGVLALQKDLPTTLRTFVGSFKGSGVNRNFRSLDEFNEYADPSRQLPFFGSKRVSQRAS